MPNQLIPRPQILRIEFHSFDHLRDSFLGLSLPLVNFRENEMQLAIHRLNFKPALDPYLGFFTVLETKMRDSQVTVTDGFIGEKID